MKDHLITTVAFVWEVCFILLGLALVLTWAKAIFTVFIGG